MPAAPHYDVPATQPTFYYLASCPAATALRLYNPAAIPLAPKATSTHAQSPGHWIWQPSPPAKLYPSSLWVFL